jgi:hypothetical protein
LIDHKRLQGEAELKLNITGGAANLGGKRGEKVTGGIITGRYPSIG